jgi:hypothetical protein
MMYSITAEDGRDVSAEEIIPHREFWERYFASGLTREAALKTLESLERREN